VARIVLDPILVEPFLLRAAARLGTNDTACLDDVRTVLELAPNTPQAFALRARVLRASGHFDEAIEACRSAEAQAPREPEFGLLHAAILADMGRFEHAIAKTRQSLGLCDRRAEMKAAALAQLGDQLAAGPKHEYKAALELHQQAVRQADPLLKDRIAEVRTMARDALLAAYLGAASDIAWGPWQSKDTVVPKWLERAEQLVASSETPEHLATSTITFCRGALEVCAAASGAVDPKPWVDKLEPMGRRRLETIRDPLASATLEWELGQAMSAAMQAFQLRNDFAAAQQKGAMAVAYLEMAIPHRQANAADTLSLARVYYRMGSMLAHDMKNDAEAVGWFDRAVPLIEDSLPSAAPGECARQGEALVSMAVSYWELVRRERSLELTTTGVQCLERAVERGALTRDALAVPYANLAAIHEFLGNDKSAKDYAAMAARMKGTQVK
jgi:tetratricopeptide (TPR) repeat protein